MPRAYLGVTVPGFPNLFLLYGPNTNGGTGSVVATIEAQMTHVIAALAERDAPERADDRRAAARRPPRSTPSCGPRWPGRSGTAAARTGTSTSTATTRASGRGRGASTAAARPRLDPAGLRAGLKLAAAPLDQRASGSTTWRARPLKPSSRENSSSAAARPRPSASWATTVTPGSTEPASSDVVEADVRDLVLQPEPVQRAQDLDRHQVLGAEDRGRPVRPGQQRLDVVVHDERLALPPAPRGSRRAARRPCRARPAPARRTRSAGARARAGARPPRGRRRGCR